MLIIQYQRSPAGHVVCRPVGNLDAFSANQFRHVLADLAAANRLMIDLTDVAFMDSTGLGDPGAGGTLTVVP